MSIQDQPCEFDKTCQAPVELLNKKFDVDTMKWTKFYTCLNKHYYMKTVDLIIDEEYDFLNDGFQEELPFSEETND